MNTQNVFIVYIYVFMKVEIEIRQQENYYICMYVISTYIILDGTDN